MIPDEESDPLAEALTLLAKDYIKDEEFVRDRFVQEVRRNILYFNGIQNIFNPNTAGTVGDWSTYNDYVARLDDDYDIDELDLDEKYINVYKAYIESLVAAISAQLPTTRFFPDDADNSDDINTAQAYEKIVPLIRRYNKSKLLLLQIVGIFLNEGVVAVRNYTDRNEKYGFADKPIVGNVVTETSTDYCPNCNSVLGEGSNARELGPDEIVEEQSMEDSMKTAICPNCAATESQNMDPMFIDPNTIPGQVNPITQTLRSVNEQVVDYQQVAKVRAKLEAYGLTNVRFPAWCTTQEEIPYLILEREQSIALVETIYPRLKGKIVETPVDTQETIKWSRSNPFYAGDTPKYTCTVQEIWFRDWALARLNNGKYGLSVESDTESLSGMVPEEEPTIGQILQQQFPEGLKLILVNGEYATHEPESLDDHWTISVNPLYKQLICKSIGSATVPIQDLKNDNIAITEQTIKFGIGETFVDSDALDTDKYSEGESRPGNITAVTRVDPSKSIGDSFFQTRPASLSQEVGIFGNRIEADGQFVSGAMPSIYGGPIVGGETAAEYSMSRAQGLQRQTIPWGIICNLWSEFEFKSVNDYVLNLDYDESYSTKQGTTYKNVYIELVRLRGKVSCVEPENDGHFPISWAQERDLVSQLLTLNNPAVNEVLMHPENRSLIAKLAGPNGLYVPGDDARQKQLAEIADLLKSAPIMATPDGMPLPQPMPSVQVDPDMDDHIVEFEIVKVWCNSAEGQWYKKNYPPQYMNVLMHGKMHKIFKDMMEMQTMQQEQGDNVEEPKSIKQG